MEGQRIPAAAISQRLLDITGEALMSGNFDRFAPAFHIPTVVVSHKGRLELDSLLAMRDAFLTVSNSLRREGVTDLVRYCLSAEYLSDTRISATHESCQMRGNLRVMDPYPSYSVIDRIGEDWKVTYSEYGLENDTPHGRAFPGPDILNRPMRPA